jgi:hypothetical protein
MTLERKYTSKRYSILRSLSQVLKTTLDGTAGFSNVYENVHPRMLFWDEIEEYPAVHMSLGNEIRIYQGGGFKDRLLNATIRCYIKDEESSEALELLLEDIETVIEQNGRLAYQDSLGATHYTQDILVLSIDTDEGALAPIAAGEITVQIRY